MQKRYAINFFYTIKWRLRQFFVLHHEAYERFKKAAFEGNAKAQIKLWESRPYFGHNFGHGYKTLNNVLVGLMLLAFLIDQCLDAVNLDFKQDTTKI